MEKAYKDRGFFINCGGAALGGMRGLHNAVRDFLPIPGQVPVSFKHMGRSMTPLMLFGGIVGFGYSFGENLAYHGFGLEQGFLTTAISSLGIGIPFGIYMNRFNYGVIAAGISTFIMNAGNVANWHHEGDSERLAIKYANDPALLRLKRHDSKEIDYSLSRAIMETKAQEIGFYEFLRPKLMYSLSSDFAKAVITREIESGSTLEKLQTATVEQFRAVKTKLSELFETKDNLLEIKEEHKNIEDELDDLQAKFLALQEKTLEENEKLKEEVAAKNVEINLLHERLDKKHKSLFPSLKRKKKDKENELPKA